MSISEGLNYRIMLIIFSVQSIYYLRDVNSRGFIWHIALLLLNNFNASFLSKLGDFLAHLQVQVVAVVHAVPCLLRGGRRGREFGRPAGRAAVVVRLPAHAWGRHLPDRPRPRTCPRAWGAAGERPVSGRVEPGRPLSDPTPAVRRPQPQARSRPRPPADPRPGTGRPCRPEAASDSDAGQTPGVRRRPGAGPALARSSARPWPGRHELRGPAGPLPPGTREPARRPPGLRREETGRAAAGIGGDRRRQRSRGPAVARDRGARGADDVISPQPSPAPRRRCRCRCRSRSLVARGGRGEGRKSTGARCLAPRREPGTPVRR